MQIREIQIEPGGWVTIPNEVRTRFKEADDGRLEPVAVEMVDGTISTRTLQKFPFGQMEAIANAPITAELIRERINDPDGHEPVTVDLAAPLADVKTVMERLKKTIRHPPQKGGRIVYPDEFFEDIAEMYSLHAAGFDFAMDVFADGKISERNLRSDLRSGQKFVPVATLAGELDVPVSTVRRWVRVCRDKGLLAQPRHGKGG